MKRELYVVLKHGRFVAAAYCEDGPGYENASRYIASQERKHGMRGLTYMYGRAAKLALPEEIKPRLYTPRVTRADIEFERYR